MVEGGVLSGGVVGTHSPGEDGNTGCKPLGRNTLEKHSLFGEAVPKLANTN